MECTHLGTHVEVKSQLCGVGCLLPLWLVIEIELRSSEVNGPSTLKGPSAEVCKSPSMLFNGHRSPVRCDLTSTAETQSPTVSLQLAAILLVCIPRGSNSSQGEVAVPPPRKATNE